jgi:septum formation protein
MTAFEKLSRVKIVLGSASPRRQNILKTQKLDFEVLTSKGAEESSENDPEAYVKDIALQKARDVQRQLVEQGRWDEKTLLIAADTIVVLDGTIYGKPRDKADAKRILENFSGKVHQVLTGLVLVYGNKQRVSCERSTVEFADLSEEEIEHYLSFDEYKDKAGAYAIQGLASVFVKRISGDYYNVVGFPIRKFYEETNQIID